MRSIVSPLDGFASPFGPQRGFNPLRIFANDEPGVWFEANDSTTLFTDTAGTTPVTAPGDAVAYQRDKSGRGNHRTQATTAARPLYVLHPVGGVRNKLQYTEEFDNAVWDKAGLGTGDAPTVTANSVTDPLGGMTADAIQFDLNGGTSSGDQCNIAQGFTPNIGDENTLSFWAKVPSGTATFTVVINGSQVEDITVNDVWQRYEVTGVSSVGVFTSYGIRTRGSKGSTDSFILHLWGAQLEEGSTATNYQRVGSFLDVSEEGKARRGRLWYNGTSHFMETGTITPGTDKVQVFAGVRKLSDAARGVLVEHSASAAANNGAFVVTAPDAASATFAFESKGTSLVSAVDTGIAAPATGVLTSLGDISGDSAILRVDGVQEAISTADQGTGNYLAYPLYFGARNGTSLFFNGYEDTSIIRFGPNLDDTTISKVESYVASKTPEETI